MRRALAIDEKSFGPEHPNVATDLNNLAQLLQDTNRLAEAEPLMRRALAIDEKSFGRTIPTSPPTSTTSPNCCKPPTVRLCRVRAPGPPVQDRPLEEAGRTDGEASRNPCEGHPDQRVAMLAVRNQTVSDEKPRRRFLRSAAAALRVAIFMLPMSQQRQFEVHRSRETIRDGAFCYGPRQAFA